MLNEQEPEGMLVAFDRPEPTFRHEAEPEYKAQREAAPDILRQQMGLVREVLDAAGIQTIDQAGWEADDLIATAADELVAPRATTSSSSPAIATATSSSTTNPM